MAKLNRTEILTAWCEKWGWHPDEDFVDADSTIDAFGKLAKSGITEEQMYEVINSGVVTSWSDRYELLDPKFIKAHSSKPTKAVKREVVKEVVTPVIEKVEIPPLDPNAILGAMGKAMGEAICGEYAPLIVESAKPVIKEFIKDTYGITEKKVKFVVPDRGEVVGVFHEKFEKVLTYAMGRRPVLLVGDAGTGKNVIAGQVAEALGLKFYFTNKVSDEFQLKGFVDANGNYQETSLYKAMKDGGVFMLDEMDASDPSALVVINSVLSDKYFTFPNGEFVEAHKDFVVIAGANTWGTGATYQYTGRNQIDAATRNRFITVKIDYSPTIEESLTSDKDLLSFIRKFRECCKNFGINHVVSYRNIITLDMYVDAVGVDDVLEDGLIQNLEKDDLSMLYGEFRQPMWNSNRWAKSFLRMCS